jgi:hypothetical protein
VYHKWQTKRPYNLKVECYPRSKACEVLFPNMIANGDHICQRHHHNYHHHQPVNVPTAGAQAFIIDYTRRTGHNPLHGPSVGKQALTTANAAWSNKIFGHPSNDWPTFLNFGDRTDRTPPSSSSVSAINPAISIENKKRDKARTKYFIDQLTHYKINLISYEELLHLAMVNTEAKHAHIFAHEIT